VKEKEKGKEEKDPGQTKTEGHIPRQQETTAATESTRQLHRFFG
jgi:hypothetical protein